MGGVWRCIVLAAAALCPSFRAVAAIDGALGAALDNVAAVRDLSWPLAARSLPVVLTATVTYYDPHDLVLFVQDATGAIFVETNAPLPIVAGSRVEVRGVTAPDFTNVITRASLKEISRGRLPMARRVSIRNLLSGERDCEYVTVTGEIRTASVSNEGNPFLHLSLQSDGQKVDIAVLDYSGLVIDSLIGAQVRVTGPVGGAFNDNEQLQGTVIRVQTAREIVVLRPASMDPYAQPSGKLSAVLRSRFESQYDRRTHLQGTVTYFSPGSLLVISDGVHALQVKTNQTDRLNVGDRVDVTGFPEFGEYSPVIEDANFRKLPGHQDIKAVPIQPADLLNGALDSKLVSFEGVLVNVAKEGKRQTLAVDAGTRVISAVVEASPAGNFPAGMSPGSRVRVTGIGVVESGGVFRLVRGCHLLLRGVSDVLILSQPPWWDTTRLIWALSLFGVVGVATFAWVVVLRQRIKAQTIEIRRVLEADTLRDKRAAAIQEARSKILERINTRESLGGILDAITELVNRQRLRSECRIDIASGPTRLSPLVKGSSTDDGFLRQPLVSAEGQSLGTMTVRSHGDELPGSAELLDLAAQLAVLAIESRRLYETLVRGSEYDLLTELPNRGSFDKKLDIAFESAKTSGSHFALLYVDLDDFNSVNDMYGHERGDDYLRAVGARLRVAMDGNGFVARLGGDEFAVLLTNVIERQQVLNTAATLTSVLGEPIFLDEGDGIPCGSSVGVALYPEDGADASELKRRADAAMYKTKAMRRHENRTSRISRGALGSVSAWTLEEAIRDGRTRVHYQPIFSSSGGLFAFEALARLEDNDGQLLTPAHFIATAERTGLIRPLGLCVLREACHSLARWTGETRGGTGMFVNVSPSQTTQPGFSGQVLEILATCGLDPALLTLELTEASILQDPDTSLHELNILQRAGVQLALDDFGAGYSNLGRLHCVPWDVIKIDRSLLPTAGDLRSQTIFRSALSLAKHLNARTIAEGVETSQQLESLRSIGVDGVQGFLLAKPMPGDTIESMLAAWLLTSCATAQTSEIPVAHPNARLRKAS